MLPYHAAPTEFFTQVYPPELIDLIVEQTNLYAEQRGVTGWVDTTQGRQRRGGWGGPSRPTFCGKICHYSKNS